MSNLFNRNPPQGGDTRLAIGMMVVHTHIHTLSRSYALTHTYTHTHILTHLQTHSLTHTQTLTHTLSHTHTHIHTLSRSYALAHTHTHTLSQSWQCGCFVFQSNVAASNAKLALFYDWLFFSAEKDRIINIAQNI